MYYFHQMNSRHLSFAILLFVSLFITFSLNSCKKDSATDPDSEQVSDEDNSLFIADEYGRQLILHGLNTSSSAKSDPERMPWIEEHDVEREATEFGFNFVRFLIFWDFVEPEKGVYNYEYLQKVQQRVEWYTNRGMYVMLDMHQDLYSIRFGGDGAPDWAIESNGASWEVDIDGPWWLRNISPAVINAWTNFWGYSKYKHLQDHYIEMWKVVAERFKSNPRVIGYDLMNEPWAGDLVKAFITGDFERKQLSDFYERLIPEIRKVESNKYLFFEPAPAPVTFGMPSQLRKMEDAQAQNKLVYAPHLYPLSTHEGGPYHANDKKNVKDWHRERKKEVKKHGGIPLLCGEFGLSPSCTDFDVYLQDFHTIMDENLWHWSYWSNDDGGWSPIYHDGTETEILQHLVRVYPKATAGRIKSFFYNAAEKQFEMMYTSNPSITQPTEIFIPRRHFSDGYQLSIQTTASYQESYDDAKQVLSIKVSDRAEVKVTISAK